MQFCTETDDQKNEKRKDMKEFSSKAKVEKSKLGLHLQITHNVLSPMAAGNILKTSFICGCISSAESNKSSLKTSPSQNGLHGDMTAEV